MARKTKLTSAEIAELEMDEAEHKAVRNTGFQKMKERDLGYGRLRDFNMRGEEVWMDWRMSREDEASQLFKLVVGKGRDKTIIVLDAEQVRRHLRWV